MLDVETCTDCGIHSPEASPERTLTSSAGWRLMRERRVDGTWSVVWRCGPCWKAHKVRAAVDAGSTTGIRAIVKSPGQPPRLRRQG